MIDLEIDEIQDTQPTLVPGDIITIDYNPSLIITEKDIALVMIGDSIAIRKIKRYVSGIFLIPLNNAFLPEFFSMEELEAKGFRILGRVVENRRKY